MNRWEFMKELDNLLADIPEEEGKEALNYYNDYFDDAGVENTADVIAKLGSPSEVAAQIRAEFATGLQPVTEKQNGEQKEESTDTFHEIPKEETKQPEEKKKMSTGMIVLIVILCILASPMLAGIGASLFGIFIAIVSVIFSLVVVFGALAVTFIVVGIVLFIGGMAACLAAPMGAVTAMGLGLVFAALGILFLILTVLIAGGLIPLICKGIYSLFKKKGN